MHSVGLVILAAGGSSRLGRPKQLLRYQGQTLLRRAALTAIESACHTIVVVLGAEFARISPELAGLPITLAENPDWQLGQGTSVRCGLTALLAQLPDLNAAVFILCDQPMLPAGLITKMAAGNMLTPDAIIAAEYGGTVGVPALFPRSVFPELMALPDDVGAKPILHRHINTLLRVSFPGGTLDIDTVQDYERLSRKSNPPPSEGRD